MAIEIDITENALYKEGKAAGEAKGAAGALLLVLKKRFGAKALSAPTRKRISAASIKELNRWLARAISASSVDDLFAS